MKLNCRFLWPLAALLCLGTAQASCVLLPEEAKVPALIKRSECLEMQGRNPLPGDLTVEGKLIVKYGTTLKVPPKARLRLKSHGQLEVRGELQLDEDSLMQLDEFAKLTVLGQMYVQTGATVLSERSSSLVLPGKVMFRPVSYLRLDRDVSLKSGGVLNFDRSKVDCDSCNLDNSGTITVINNSILEFSGSTRIRNRGTLSTDLNTMLNLQDRSYLDNERKVSLKGVVNFSGASSLQNRFIFTIEEQGRLNMSDGVTFGNHHIVNLYGTLNLDEHVKYDNLKNLQIGKQGLLNIRGQALMTNRGSVYDRGTVRLERLDNLKNQHIFFINELQQSRNVEETLFKQSREALPQGAPAP